MEIEHSLREIDVIGGRRHWLEYKNKPGRRTYVYDSPSGLSFEISRFPNHSEEMITLEDVCYVIYLSDGSLLQNRVSLYDFLGFCGAGYEDSPFKMKKNQREIFREIKTGGGRKTSFIVSLQEFKAIIAGSRPKYRYPSSQLEIETQTYFYKEFDLLPLGDGRPGWEMGWKRFKGVNTFAKLSPDYLEMGLVDLAGKPWGVKIGRHVDFKTFWSLPNAKNAQSVISQVFCDLTR